MNRDSRKSSRKTLVTELGQLESECALGNDVENLNFAYSESQMTSVAASKW